MSVVGLVWMGWPWSLFNSTGGMCYLSGMAIHRQNLRLVLCDFTSLGDFAYIPAGLIGDGPGVSLDAMNLAILGLKNPLFLAHGLDRD